MLSGRSRDTGVGTVPPLCAFSQECVQAEYLLLTEAGTAHTSRSTTRSPSSARNPPCTSAIDVLTPDIDFGVSEQLDVLDDPQYLSQHSEADSFSTIEQNDSQASLAMSQEATPNTSFSEQKFKKP